MASDARKTSEKETEEAPASAEASAPAANPESEVETHLLPFAQPYNQYFETVGGAFRSLVRSANEAYGAYVKATREAMEAGDPEALRNAAREFSQTWGELGKPLTGSIGQAFDDYHKAVAKAFASGASAPLGPGCLMLVSRSIATVSWHRAHWPQV